MSANAVSTKYRLYNGLAELHFAEERIGFTLILKTNQNNPRAKSVDIYATAADEFAQGRGTASIDIYAAAADEFAQN